MSRVLDWDLERNRRMDPDRVRLGPDGREMTEFIASYDRGNGLRQMIGVWAFSSEDAKLRIQQMRRSLVFEGPAADFEPVEWEFRPSRDGNR